MDSQQWMAVAILTIVLFGCSGNVLSFLLFSRPHMRTSSVNVLLCALSFVDFCMLLLCIPTFVVPNLDILSQQDGTASTFLAIVLKFIYPVSLTLQTCSIYIMLMITLERWTAVCRPLQVRIWCSSKKSRIAVVIIFACAVAYNFIRFFEYEIIVTETGLSYQRLLRDPERHRFYVIIYFTVLYLLTHFAIPFGVILVFNGHVCRVMWKLRQQREMLTRQQQREQNTTRMLLMVTFCFFVCNTLPFLLNIWESIYPNLFRDEWASLAYQLNDLANLLVVLNSATTVIVYFVFSEKYRETFMFILKNGCCASMSDYNHYSAMSRTASMRVSTYQHKTSTASMRGASQHKVSTTSFVSSDLLLKPQSAEVVRRSSDASAEAAAKAARKANDIREPRRAKTIQKCSLDMNGQRPPSIQSKKYSTELKAPEILVTQYHSDETDRPTYVDDNTLIAQDV